MFAVFHPPTRGHVYEKSTGRDGDGCGSDVGVQEDARSAVLLEALADVPRDMARVIGRYLEELEAGAAASVSIYKYLAQCC